MSNTSRYLPLQELLPGSWCASRLTHSIPKVAAIDIDMAILKQPTIILLLLLTQCLFSNHLTVQTYSHTL